MVVKMKKRQQQAQSNYLDLVPRRAEGVQWHVEDAEAGEAAGSTAGAGECEAAASADAGIVVLDIENKGAFNKVAQTLFGKPRITHVHLDTFGSFVWSQIDGQRTVESIAALVHDRFGDEAEPLYPRIAKYMQIVESYGFIELVAQNRES